VAVVELVIPEELADVAELAHDEVQRNFQ